MRGDIRRVRRHTKPAQPPVRRSAIPAAPVASRIQQPVRSPATPATHPARKPAAPQAAAQGIRPKIHWGFRPRTAVVAVALIAAVTLIGLRAQGSVAEAKGDVAERVGVARQALGAAQEQLKEANLAEAEHQFEIAEQSFSDANQLLADKGLVGGLAAGQGSGDIRTGQQMLTAGEDTARAGRELLQNVQGLSKQASGSDQGFYRSGEVLNQQLPKLEDNLADLDRNLKLLGFLQQRAARSQNPELNAAAKEFGAVLPPAREAIAGARDTLKVIPEFLGNDEFSRYLLLFQNPAELRATGGFIGTYGQLTLDQGRIKELTVDSIYNPANQANQVIKDKAPEPYARFFGENQRPVWGMQDANWSPDFPTSAKRFMSNYGKAGGPSSDGVIALTTTPIEQMLAVLGPIEMPQYGYTLTSENFRTLIQSDQETRSQAADQDPKKILRDFLPSFLEKARQATPDQQNQLYKVLADAVRKRDIQMYFTDGTLEKLADQAGMSGQVKPSDNLFSVIDTNIAGKKSSADIQASVRRELTIADSGQISGRVSVHRQHTAASTEDINKNYTRILLPPDTEVGETDGWYEYDQGRIYQEDGVTVVGGWTDVDPGQERDVNVAYTLKHPLDLTKGRFTLEQLKQSGTAIQATTVIELPASYVWDGAPGVTINGNRAEIQEHVLTDLSHPLTFRKLP